MSGFGVEPEDMRRATVLDKKLDALLAGAEPAPGDDIAAELASTLKELDTAFPTAVVSEQVEDVHIARMIEAATESVASVTPPLAPVRSSLLDRMRVAASRRVAAASLAFTAAFGGAAYAGALPAPVQRAMADAGAAVGLQLPRPGNDGNEGSVAGDRDDRDAREVTDGRADSDYRRAADAVAAREEGDIDVSSGRATERTRGSHDRGSDDARGDRDDDDSNERDHDDDDSNDRDDDDHGDDHSGGAARDGDGDDDDVEYEAPDGSGDSDREDDATEREDDEDSSFDDGDDRDRADSDHGTDELDVDSDAVEDPSDN